MKVMGAHVRVRADRYLTGFVLIEGTSVEFSQSFPAPPDESEAGQLGELYGRVEDLIGRWSPDLLALKISEIQQRPAYVTAHRAEGALLGAAGRYRSMPASFWSGQKLWKPAGFAKPAKTQASVDALCARLSPAPEEPEVRQAAAAAVAALLKNT